MWDLFVPDTTKNRASCKAYRKHQLVSHRTWDQFHSANFSFCMEKWALHQWKLFKNVNAWLRSRQKWGVIPFCSKSWGTFTRKFVKAIHSNLPILKFTGSWYCTFNKVYKKSVRMKPCLALKYLEAIGGKGYSVQLKTCQIFLWLSMKVSTANDKTGLNL